MRYQELYKKIFLLCILALVSVIWYRLFTIRPPCDSPISYRMGSFDARFGISKKDFLDKIDKAAAVWNKAVGKNVFEYSPTGELVINLMYDTRQKTTQKNNILNADITKISTLAQSVKTQYTTLEEEHKLLDQAYTNALAGFEQNQNNYNSKVGYWNNNGGAPSDVYNTLLIEKQNLLQEETALEEKRLELNTVVNQINDFIKKYNLLISDVNSNINTINQSADKEFEEGLYVPSKNEIDIYEFSSNQKLIRVLIHELGHSLGLPHNENPKSIMYPINSGTSLSLSIEDIRGLKTACNLK